jgi:hypothetical protein
VQVDTVRQQLAAVCNDIAVAARVRLVAQQGFTVLLKALAGLSSTAAPAPDALQAPAQPDHMMRALQEAASCLQGAGSPNS